jgi:PAS domain S-box-containing protein
VEQWSGSGDAAQAEWLTAVQVARLLNVAVSTLEDWIQSGRLHPHGIGNDQRYSPDEVAALQKQLWQTEQTKSPSAALIHDLNRQIEELFARQQQLRAEAEARAQDYRRLIETAAEGIWVVDAQSRTTLVNNKLAEMFGYTPEEMLGQPFFAFMDEEWKAVAQIHLEHRRQGIAEQYDFKFRHKNGSDLWMILSTDPIFDVNGQYAGALKMLTDITERRRTEELLERYKLLSEYASDIILFIDQHGQIIEANNTAVKVYGYSREELLQLNIQTLRDPSTFVELPGQLEQVQNQAVLFETLHRRKDGTIFPVEVSSQAMQLGDRPIFLSIIRDITDRRKAEEEHARLLAQLEAVIWQMPEGLIMAEAPSGKLIRGNKQVEEIWRQPFLRSQDIAGYQEWKGFHLEDGRPYLPEEWPLARAISRGEIVRNEEIEYLRGDGTRGIMQNDASPIRDSEGRIIAGVVTFYDITERKRAEQDLRFLAESSALLTFSLDYQTTLTSIARLTIPYLADLCVVDLVAGPENKLQRVAVAHADQLKEQALLRLAREYPPQPGPTNPLRTVLETGQAVLLSEIDPETMLTHPADLEYLHLVEDTGPHRSSMIIPMVARGRVLGAITFETTGLSERRYSERELSLAEDLVRRVAVAVDNARLYEAEQVARYVAEQAAGRTSRLQGITALLSEALTRSQVAEIIVDQGVAALGAQYGALVAVSEDGQYLDLLRGIGYPAQLLEKWQRFSLQSMTPLTEVVRTGKPVWLTNRNDLKDYPDTYVTQVLTNSKSLVAVPLLVDNRPLGALALSFTEAQKFDEDDRSFILALAQQCAQALERARLYEAEQLARTKAEASEARLAFLAEASKLAASSLDAATILTSIARQVVPYLADMCVVDLAEPEGAFRRVAVTHVDPEKEAIFQETLRLFTPPPGKSNPLLAVLRSGQSVLVAEVKAAMIEGFARDQEHQEVLQKSGPYYSSMVVPLVARGRTLGALTLSTTDNSCRYYNEKDLALAEDLARRIGTALDNIRLYQEAQLAAHQQAAARNEAEKLAGLLAERAEELNTIIEAMPDGVFVCDTENHMLRVNAKAAEMFGVSVEEALRPGTPLNAMNQVRNLEGNPLSVKEMPLALALKGETRTDFRMITRRPGSTEDSYLRASYAPIRDNHGEIIGAVAVASDITELHRLERQKDEFLGIASHELKTPITAIKGLTQLTIRRLVKAGHMNEVDTLRGLDRQLDRLTDLVNDLLDVSRIGTGKLETRAAPFDLAALVRRSVNEMQATTDQHQIKVETPESLELLGDADRLEQVLTNLLGNAIKYSPEGGSIEVKLTHERQQALLSVRDHGIGIPPQSRASLFQRFYRAENVNEHRISGFGIGLFICSEIVRRHGGRIWLADLPSGENGSLFCVALPLQPPEE